MEHNFQTAEILLAYSWYKDFDGFSCKRSILVCFVAVMYLHVLKTLIKKFNLTNFSTLHLEKTFHCKKYDTVFSFLMNKKQFEIQFFFVMQIDGSFVQNK